MVGILLPLLFGGIVGWVLYVSFRLDHKTMRKALDVIDSQQRAVYLLAHRIDPNGVVDFTKDEAVAVFAHHVDVSIFKLDDETFRVIAK